MLARSQSTHRLKLRRGRSGSSHRSRRRSSAPEPCAPTVADINVLVVRPRRSAKRLYPIQFADAVEDDNQARQTFDGVSAAHFAGPTEAALRTSSMEASITNESLHLLRELFEMCAGRTGEQLVDEGELCMLFQLMGVKETKAKEMVHKYALSNDHQAPSGTEARLSLNFSTFLVSFREALAMCAARYSLPTGDFLMRCNPLKNGFKKCDGSGDARIEQSELEIAMQKLDVIHNSKSLCSRTWKHRQTEYVQIAQ